MSSESKSSNERMRLLEFQFAIMKLYLSYLSASAAPLGPSNRQIAKLVNPEIKSFIRTSAGRKKPFGVVIFDFPTSDIIRSLIQINPGL